MPFPLHCGAWVLGISIIATIKLPIKMDGLLRTWEPAGCLKSGSPHIWFSLLDKYTASYWMSHRRVSPHFIGLLCHYSHSTSCFSKVEVGSMTADRCLFQLKYCLKKNSCKFWLSIIDDTTKCPGSKWHSSIPEIPSQEPQLQFAYPPASPIPITWFRAESKDHPLLPATNSFKKSVNQYRHGYCQFLGFKGT